MTLSGGDVVPPAIKGRAPAARLAHRLSVSAVLDIISIARRGRNVLDTLLLSTITQSNIAPVNQQGDLQVAYAGADEAPPDEIRRPISVNALATSLGLPFETVRRRVKGLLEAGDCVLQDGGLVAPAEQLSTPEHVAALQGVYERLRVWYYDMRDLDLLGDLPPPTVKLDAQSFPIRTVARLVTEFNLRLIERLMTYQGDAINVLITLEIFRANTEGFKAKLQGGESFEASELIPDKLRTPVSASALARKLGLPPETVRRHVEHLIRRGPLQRVPGGLILPSEVLANPRSLAVAVESLANLQRLFASMSQLGVLALWDSLNPPRAQPAAVSQRA
jgi:hypothetical protein